MTLPIGCEAGERTAQGLDRGNESGASAPDALALCPHAASGNAEQRGDATLPRG